MDDSLTYDGSLSQKSNWLYTQTTLQAEISGSTSELEEQIKQTSARIDKIESEIELLVIDNENFEQQVTALTLDSENINLTVKNLQEAVTDRLTDVQETLNKVVEQNITAENVTISVKEELMESGVTKITTETGFTFDKDGLNISKENSDITTQITEDGMTIYNQGEEVLKANNEGVKATDLHATTYLIIGNNSRFEDYNTNRTGCFWIGG